MKKITLGLGFFFLSHSSFALTNQLRFGEKYLLNKEYIVVSKDILIDNRLQKDNEPNIEDYIDISYDIYVGNKSKAIKALQKQWGLEETGIYNQSMLKAVKESQTLMGLNPTGIIDKNTWFAIYEQPMSWRISAVKKCYGELENNNR